MAIKFRPIFLAKLAREITELYDSESDFITFDAPDCSVHLSERGMARFFGPNEVTRSERFSESYKYEFSAHYQGATFYCITNNPDIFKEVR